MKRRTLLCFFLFLCVAFSVFSQDSGLYMLQQGIEKFRKSDFTYAIYDFREVTLDPKFSSFHGYAYFWLAKSYMALNQLDDAEKNLEYFLLRFPEHPDYAEGFYQKGRLLFLQREYEKSIQVFYTFIEKYTDNPFLPNSYYWIGESLYELGHVDKALTVFKYVISQYPRSYKVEAARYKVSLIKLENRERELLKFLKWSHEESLKTLEEFQVREKTYEQALSAYQKKLTKFAEEGTSSQIEDLTLDLIRKDKEIISLKNEITNLKRENASLTRDIKALETRIAAVPEEEPVESALTEPTSAFVSESTVKRLLAIKEEALNLKEFYLNWLENELEKQ